MSLELFVGIVKDNKLMDGFLSRLCGGTRQQNLSILLYYQIFVKGYSFPQKFS